MGFIAKYRRELKDVWEELVALTITTLGSGLTGMIFGLGNVIIAMKSSVLMLAPASMGMRGNIYSSLGSRLGSLLHLGYIEPKISKNPLLIENVLGVLTLKTTLTIYIGVLASLAYLYISGLLDIVDLTLIGFLTTFMALPIMLAVTFTVTFITFSRGLDPDNFSAPVITLAGDVISLPILLISTYIVLKTHLNLKYVVLILSILLTASLVSYVVFSKREYLRRVVFEAAPILMICGLLEMFAGSALTVNVERILAQAGILTIVPGFLEDSGALGGILAARISTKLHLGEIEPKLLPSIKVVKEFVKIFTVAFLIYPALGTYGYFVAKILKLPIPSLITIVMSVLVAGVFLLIVTLFMVYFVSIMSFKKGLDPDNITIPLITSGIDAIGTFILMYSLLIVAPYG